MISMKLVVLGDIPLGIWIVILLWPFDCVSYTFHDGYALDGLYIEGVFEDSTLVLLNIWVFIGSYGWVVERIMILVGGPATRSKVWLRRTRCRARRRSLVKSLEWMLGTSVLRT